MLKATYKSSYTKEGVTRHVYVVTGTAEEIAKYKAIKEAEIGKAVACDEISGNPLYITTFLDQNTLELDLSKTDKYYAVGCPRLKLLRDKKNALEASKGSDREIGRIEDRILDRELEIADSRPRKSAVKQEADAPGTNL